MRFPTRLEEGVGATYSKVVKEEMAGCPNIELISRLELQGRRLCEPVRTTPSTRRLRLADQSTLMNDRSRKRAGQP